MEIEDAWDYIFRTEYPECTILDGQSLEIYKILIKHPLINPCLYLNSECCIESHFYEEQEYLQNIEYISLIKSLIVKYLKAESQDKNYYWIMIYDTIDTNFYYQRVIDYLKMYVEYYIVNDRLILCND